MTIFTDPNDPEFRKALRELGAPEWYPQDAPRHIVSGSSEQLSDGTWLSKLVCPICGWEKHFVSGENMNRSMKSINEGDRWAFHQGSTAPEILQITGVEVQQDEPVPDVFAKFIEDLDDRD